MPGEAPIRVRIGASLEASVDRSFATFERRAAKAQVAVQRGQRQTASSAEKEAQKAAKAQEKAAKEIERAAQRLARVQEREATKAARTQERENERAAKNVERYWTRAHQRSVDERLRAARKIEAALEREARAAERAMERERRARARSERRAGESFARRTSDRASRFLTPNAPIASMAARGFRDVASGAGVDLSIQGGVQRSVALQTAAVQLANQERIATGKTRGAGAYAQMGRTVGDATFADPGSSLALASKFAARTGTYGNLDQITGPLASLARASGADPEQVGEAAGMIFQQFRGQADAIQKTVETMRTIIGQSAEGAVDMPDYAKQLGRVAAGAFKFDGPRERNIAALSALTQISMERGATSPADAARSTGSFVSTLGKGARLAEFEKAGVRVYNDDTMNADGTVKAGDQRTTLRPLEDIIKDSFRATQGNIPMLGRMYMDVLGRKGVESLGSEFQAAGGGEAGIDAIQRVFDRYMNATITKDVERQNLQDVGNSAQARAQKFQNALDRVTDNVLVKLLPALESAGPAVLKFADVLGKTATWAVENPKTAIGVAIGAAIARAGIESTLRSGIERLMLGPAGADGKPGGRAGKIGKAAAALGAIGTIAALTVTTIEVGKLIIDHFLDESDNRHRKTIGHELDASNLSQEAQAKLEKGDVAGAKKTLEKETAEREAAIKAREEDKKRGNRGSVTRGLLGALGVDFSSHDAQQKRNDEELAAQRRELVESKELQRQMVQILGEIAAKEPPAADADGTGRRVPQ